MYELKSDISEYFSSFLPWQCSVTLLTCKVILRGKNEFALYKNLSQIYHNGHRQGQCQYVNVLTRE